MPPVARPNSGMYPAVTTFTSLMNSVDSAVPTRPKPGLLTDNPSSM